MNHSRLASGTQLPAMRRPPGACERPQVLAEATAALARHEAPGINTLVQGATDLVLADAVGANVVDTVGNRYIDLVGGFGVALLGHRHPRVTAAIARQAERLVHGLGDVYANPPRIEAAAALCGVAPQGDPHVYFAVSGADAVEIALKTAVLHTKRWRVLAFDPGYHGLTSGALAVTSRPAFRTPFARQTGVHVERLPFGCDLDRVRETLSGGDFAAVVFEPVVGREGVLFPPAGWVAGLLQACAEAGVVSIADEIFSGLKRTGPRFAHCATEWADARQRPSAERPGAERGGTAERAVAEPDPALDPVSRVETGDQGTPRGGRPVADLICCGKALGGGLPIAAVLGNRSLFRGWDQDGEALHTGTFVAHPLACAAAVAVLAELHEPWVEQRLAAIEGHLGQLEQRLATTGAAVRGRGALWAIDCSSREAARQLQKSALQRGVLTLSGGPTGRVVQLVPPLVISDEQLAFVVDTLAELAAGA